MSRYSCSYALSLSPEKLDRLYDDLLQFSVFEVMHRRADVLVLLELPNEALFSQLVTIELFNTTTSPSDIQIDLLVKNHELPLRANNRCRQFFDRIDRLIIETYQGRSLIKRSA